MSKKFISVMLALVMVLSVFSISAFAVNVEFEDLESEAYNYQMWYLETANEPDANGNYTVDVYLEASYYVGAISFHVDAVGATLKNADATDFIYDADGYNADVEVNKSKGNVYIIPKPTDATKYGLDVTSATHIATLTYTLTADSATITLVNDAKTIDNDGMLIAARLGDGILASNTMYYGQFINDIDYNELEVGDIISEVTLGEEVAAADPVLNGVGTGVVDEARGYVYGVKVGDPVDGNYFTVENGSFEMVANELGVTNGTGSTLVVKDAAGNEFATYTLIIFGDVDGNGAPELADYGLVFNASLGVEIEDDAQNFAADVDGNGAPDLADYGLVFNASLGVDITVNPYAA